MIDSKRISVYIAPGEAAREDALRDAARGDGRFTAPVIRSEMPADLQFGVDVPSDEPYCGSGILRKTLHIELKTPQDYVNSVLSGHLYEQVLSIRETGQNGCVVILGDLGDIQAAIKESAAGRHLRGSEAAHNIASTYTRGKSFKKRSFLNGCPVFWKGDDSGFFDSDDQFKDILELAHDYLCDGLMMGFAQRPADGERDQVASAMLFKGIGPSVMKEVLKDYRLAFVPRLTYSRPVEEMPGIGKMRAKAISERIVMFYEAGNVK